MISSRADLERYLAADLKAAGLDRWKWRYRFVRPVVAWTRHLRQIEYILNTHKAPWQRVYVALRIYLFTRHSIALGFRIPPNVFGAGLSVAYWGSIVVSKRARVGENCRIHPGVCIGSSHQKAPIIGDDCYFGPGAKAYGAIFLGDKTRVGANAVVNKSFPGGNCLLVGAPARIAGKRDVAVQAAGPGPDDVMR